MITAVLFDLFETLITESGTQPDSVSAVAPRLGCDTRLFRKEWKALRPAVTIGTCSFREALRAVTTRLGCPADDHTLQRLSEERARIKARPFAVIEPQVLLMIDALRHRGIRVGVVSNCFAEDVAAWPDCALAPRVECAVFSYEVGLAKPDHEIFNQAARRLNTEPADTLFIADGSDRELEGAELAGLRAFRALWFVRRWPHFRDEPAVCDRCIENPEDVVRLVDR